MYNFIIYLFIFYFTLLYRNFVKTVISVAAVRQTKIEHTKILLLKCSTAQQIYKTMAQHRNYNIYTFMCKWIICCI